MGGPWTIAGDPQVIDVIGKDGKVRSSVSAYFAGTHFFTEDMSIDIEAGDEIRRPLPNDKEQAFIVEDPTCYTGGPFGAHYQIKVSPKGNFPRHQGGHYQITVSGQNSRVNFGSTDSSVNVIMSGNVFNDVRQALASTGIEQAQLDLLNKRVAAMEAAEDQASFAKAYQSFIGSVADHIGVITPLLPGLTAVLSSLPG